MHFILGLIAIATAAYFLIIRARNAAEMTHELMDVADDVRAAARRLGFRRNKAQHPVEAIEDPSLAAATLALAYLEIDGLPTEERKNALLLALQSRLELSLKEAEEMVLLANWLIQECQGPQPAIARVSRKLFKMTEGNIGPTMDILNDVSEAPLSARQKTALEDIKTAFRLR